VLYDNERFELRGAFALCDARGVTAERWRLELGERAALATLDLEPAQRGAV
jgi:hypothetical protein